MNNDKEQPLAAPELRRPRSAGALRFLYAQGPRLREALRQKPEALREAMRKVAAVADGLPQDAIPTDERGGRRRAELANLSELLMDLARAQEAAQAEGYQGGPAPAELRLLASRLRRYRYLRAKSATALNDALDLRQALGGLLAHLVTRISDGVEAWLKDPREQATWSQVEAGFAPILLNKEQVLQQLNATRAGNASEKAALEAQVQEAEERLNAEDVATALRQGVPVPRESLERAARWHAQHKDSATEDRSRRR